MQDRNWWIGGWWERCSRCGLEIEDDASIYCSNCGKFLGKIRGTLVVPIIVSICFFAAAGLLVAMWWGGLEPQDPTELTGLVIALGAFGVLSLLVPVPLGRFVLRREKWEAEATRRNEEEKMRKLEERNRRAKEDQAERDRSANAKAKSGIDVRIETGDLEKAREMLKGALDKFSVGFRKKPSIKVPLTDEEGNPLGIIDLENGEAGATLEKMGQLGFRLGLEHDGDDVLQSMWLGKPPLPREEFPLFDSNGFIRHQVGSILVKDRLRLRKCLNSGAQLFYTTIAGGKIDSFCLGPIEPTNESAFDHRKARVEAQLPVRNGPALRIEFQDCPEQAASFEDIKRNLEEVYRWKGQGNLKVDELPEFLRVVRMPALPREQIVGVEIRNNNVIEDFPTYDIEIQTKRVLPEITVPRKQFKYPGQVLQWEEYFDDDDLPYYEAASPYHDDGSQFLFRIRFNKPNRRFYLDHDAELVRPNEKWLKFNTLDAAMMACEVARSEIVLEEARKEKGK